MAETTTDETELTRAEAASFLRSIADELDADRGRVGIPVGNKEVRLSPPERIDLETAITERSRLLRKDVEEVSLTFRWNPTGETAESGTGNEMETETETETGTETGTGTEARTGSEPENSP